MNLWKNPIFDNFWFMSTIENVLSFLWNFLCFEIKKITIYGILIVEKNARNFHCENSMQLFNENLLKSELKKKIYISIFKTSVGHCASTKEAFLPLELQIADNWATRLTFSHDEIFLQNIDSKHIESCFRVDKAHYHLAGILTLTLLEMYWTMLKTLKPCQPIELPVLKMKCFSCWL